MARHRLQITPRRRAWWLIPTTALLILTLRPDLSVAGGPRRSVWLRVYTSARRADAQRVRKLLAPEGMRGGRLHQVFLRRTGGTQGALRYEVLLGPFADRLSAVLRGLALRKNPRLKAAGYRLRALAVLLPRSFLPLPLRIEQAGLERLNPGGKRPFPVLGDLLVAKAYAFSFPRAALPAMEHSVASFAPWKPLVALGEKEVCQPSATVCLRWYEVLHSVLIRTVWLPAFQLSLRRLQTKVVLPEGVGTTRARSAFWEIARGPKGRIFQLMFRRGRLPPQLQTLTLTEAQRPPFRLVVDKHGPGIYNDAGLVVIRPKVKRWVYKRPYLWKIPKSLRRQRKGRRRRRRRARRPRRRRARPMRPSMSPAMRRPPRRRRSRLY